MKSFEAIASILLVVGIYSAISQSVTLNLYGLRTNPDYIGAKALEAFERIGGLNSMVRNYDIKGLTSMVSYVLPPEIRSDLFLEFSTNLNVKNTLNKTIFQNIAFTYNFPKYVDKDSISVKSLSKNYQVNPLWRWKRNKIEILNNSTNAKTNMILRIENITLDNAEETSGSTVVVYENSNELDYSIFSWLEHGNTINATLDVNIGKMNPFESKTLYVYYSNSESPFTTSKNQSSSGSTYSDVDILKFNYENSSRADVYIYLSNTTANFEEKMMMIYTIGAGRASDYNSTLTSYNNTGVSIKLVENTVKEGSVPSSLQRPSQYYSTEKMVVAGDINTKIKIDIWYIY
ncbi:MAG: hypothetical protein PHW96_03580 [Candidatus Nanoarchaeia archaeon]|nr:hypothetical protein [Candidatus Nanoarchaeia archaeon]